ncbi:beta-lactamase [Streptococcus pneumoniae]|nr:beta-lactamase [Streptococcus pneumoniae]CTJ91263.1 beta-lactamase [Streptococcus pneumoniae]CTK12289.1 beta-lactamase [Streptococcus pneumoniae]CTK61761.1 beta-lactamase [Streptococcus pneumoniae]
MQTEAGLVYDLASVSKVVGVGTVCTFLWEIGQLDIDRLVIDFLPESDYPDITIRQLLTHATDLDPFIPNRDLLTAPELKEAMFHLNRRSQLAFLYSDVHFLLLGFILERIFNQDLDVILKDQVWKPWGMTETKFGPVELAVPTVRGVEAGIVHDPKARLLGRHAGSAGLFSTIKDLQIFLEHYLADDFARDLNQNFSPLDDKERSLAWNLEGDWLDHTGYTGTFIMWNRQKQEATIFLSNRTYEKDERAQWILDRNQVMNLIRKEE